MKQPTSRVLFCPLICVLALINSGCDLDTSPNAGNKNSKKVVRQTTEGPVDFEERFIAAREHASRGDYDQAYDVLYDISERGDTKLIRLRADIELCRTLVKLNRKEEAYYKRNASIIRLKELTDTDTPELGYMLLLAEAYAGNADFETADRMIEDTRLNYTDDKSRSEIARIASKIQLNQAEEIENIEEMKDFRNKLEFLGRALALDERNRNAHFQLIRDYIFSKLNKDQQIWLMDASIESADPSVVRIAIGVRESLRGNSAAKHFRIARESFPKTGDLVNELADYMIKSKSLPEEKLLTLVNAAIETCPEAVHLLRTRAMLQMRIGNYQSAANDFQKFIEIVPDEFCIWSHKMLIEAQKQLGNVDAVNAQEKKIAAIIAGFSRSEQARVMRILQEVNKEIEAGNTEQQ